MYRTKTCGELRALNVNETVTLAGWVQKTRKMGGMTFVDLRDRYGITQLVFNQDVDAALCEKANKLGREFVIQVTGVVKERSNKNMNIPTGEVELIVSELNVLNQSITPPFTIEDETDGGDDLRMKYRYLDLRRNTVRANMELRHKMSIEVRRYMDSQDFMEVETPVLVSSTPEGARDFVVPSRMNPGQFYALPQSPQTLKQLLMVSGFDRYFQIVKCFRDEDLRADRQPEFTQIDCEMSFVEQDDILNMFEGLSKYLFKTIRGIEINEPFQRMSWHDAMKYYGSDKPDLRFDMRFVELDDILKGHGFSVFDNAAYVGGICAKGAAHYTRKQLDALTDFVKRPQIGAKGMVYARVEEDGNVKSSVDKFYTQEVLQQMKEVFGAEAGDLILILSGEDVMKTRKQLNELRLEMGSQLGLRDKNKFVCLWVVDFPLLEWSEEDNRFYAMHHPFTSPKPEDIHLLDSDPGAIRANAYDMVINGVEVGGGSIRIHDSGLQNKMFKLLGFTEEQADAQFGFLMNAFKYGAPPHGGIAYGLDRWVSLFAGLDSIRDCIAFPKNNSGRDVMLDAPSVIAQAQLDELLLTINED
ncbi:aspartyl-tRNA synthetase [Parabacteroides sp. PF5-5]|uniref:aspartate--tRNA ligase n=1 Tax=unclassified Parabacteroides TaxID=2649774 RepID=UPI002476DBE4|nr:MULTISPECIES: aspartate--tRNA ligase [unclassified Parabacteroides]MDH6303932.1 aspartyl-tRNA synthetase [Parabacteroides sp. PH5-39]MDH6314549.1 aspartyl-tRNA synthetase [Parabacteroides sp. PF5-13]MDH6318386.1 aspartyl-tRNA synthetase [Parabacteroides sp. PH5-13]MDH6322321.1 aspartyl-tRNA synthetase [Parabacteroides sp. PH5-8]MDH6325599.1 aspartyl-tRNA synthetase [Parabacteroides sp. PH5-41]